MASNFLSVFSVIFQNSPQKKKKEEEEKEEEEEGEKEEEEEEEGEGEGGEGEEEECLFDQMFLSGDLQLRPTRGRYHAGHLVIYDAFARAAIQTAFGIHTKEHTCR